MRIVEWTESHAVHVPAVDDEHQELFRICEELRLAITAGCPMDEVQPIVDRLVVHVGHHFTHEEREMRVSAYSHYAWHRRQHQTARANVRRLTKRLQGGDRDAAIELVDYLSIWLNDHVRLADRMLGAYLRNHQREHSARAS